MTLTIVMINTEGVKIYYCLSLLSIYKFVEATLMCLNHFVTRSTDKCKVQRKPVDQVKALKNYIFQMFYPCKNIMNKFLT